MTNGSALLPVTATGYGLRLFQSEMGGHLHVAPVDDGAIGLEVGLVRAGTAQLLGRHLGDALPEGGNDFLGGPDSEATREYLPA